MSTEGGIRGAQGIDAGSGAALSDALLTPEALGPAPAALSPKPQQLQDSVFDDLAPRKRANYCFDAEGGAPR